MANKIYKQAATIGPPECVTVCKDAVTSVTRQAARRIAANIARLPELPTRASEEPGDTPRPSGNQPPRKGILKKIRTYNISMESNGARNIPLRGSKT